MYMHVFMCIFVFVRFGCANIGVGVLPKHLYVVFLGRKRDQVFRLGDDDRSHETWILGER